VSRKEKLLLKLKSKAKDFTWQELEALLKYLGYQEKKKGKTSGSRRKFVHDSAPFIILHKPHPGNLLKRYQVEQILAVLEEGGLL